MAMLLYLLSLCHHKFMVVLLLPQLAEAQSRGNKERISSCWRFHPLPQLLYGNPVHRHFTALAIRWEPACFTTSRPPLSPPPLLALPPLCVPATTLAYRTASENLHPLFPECSCHDSSTALVLSCHSPPWNPGISMGASGKRTGSGPLSVLPVWKLNRIAPIG